jgi:Nif-specific regulatory protein
LDELQKFDDQFHPAADPDGAGPQAETLDRKYRDVLEVSVLLSSTLDLTDLLGNILDGVLKVTGCERALLMLKEPDGKFSMHVGRTKDQTEWKQEALWISRTIVNRVVETGKPLVESNILEADELRDIGSIHDRDIRSVFCYPLQYKGDLVGVIYADSGFVVPQVLDSDHSILDAFSAQAALAIENARRHGQLQSTRDTLEDQNLSLRKQLGQQYSFSGMVSRNKAMLDVFETVKRIAPHDINVLVHGRSGTGKELLARAIHDKSARSDAPFVAVNCAGIPINLVESVLFGHAKGSFTGAVANKAGHFEIADGGTLFLDEVGDMPLDVQPKILRAVQEGEIQRVGEEGRTRRVNVRIICATHKDLGTLIGKGDFREDLFYRLNEAHVQLPPLCDRREDIVPLAEYFLEKYHKEKNAPLPRLSDGAKRLLMGAPWEGNVRELQSAVHWGIAFQDDDHVVHAPELERFFDQGPGRGGGVQANGTLKGRIREFEEREIRRTLEANNFNVTSTAKELGISRQQLYNKVRDFGIKTKRSG